MAHMRGSFGFSNRTTANPNSIGTTGNAFASFLLGEADSSYRKFTEEKKLRNFYVGSYIQDDIKFRPKLTVNAGLRWDGHNLRAVARPRARCSRRWHCAGRAWAGPGRSAKANRIEPWEYDRALYKKRNECEQLFRRLKSFRRIFSRSAVERFQPR